MDRSVAEQEREIRDLVKRAEKALDRSGPQRRDTLRRLIALTHAAHPALKCYAAGHIRLFFRDFPALEEEAINAVYDLCEDQDPRVRIEGYAAIVQVSKEQKRWVKRNADVLVQLLQSDEPDEVVVVKRALQEHLDMDPPAALGVLCDQIAPPAEPLDADEQQTRDRLRTLVLAFLAGEARRCIARHAGAPGSEAEAVLVDGVLAAIPKLGYGEIEKITKELLLTLPSFSAYSSRANDLLGLLLDRAQLALEDDMQSAPPSLQSARSFFDLASHLVLDKRIASPERLLHFYYQSLNNKPLLSALPKDDCVYLIERVAEAAAAAEGEHAEHPDRLQKAQWDSLREQVATLTPTMVNLLAKHRMPSAASWKACGPLLRACIAKKLDKNWTMPLPLTSSLRQIERIGEQTETGDKELVGKTQALIKSLLSPPTVSSPPTVTFSSEPLKQKPDNLRKPAAPVSKGLPRPGFDKLPPKPPPQSQPLGDEPLSGTSDGGDMRGARPLSAAGPSTIHPNKREHGTDDGQQSHKKLKRNGNTNGSNTAADSAPSLLSRIAIASAPTGQALAPQQRRTNTDRKSPGSRVVSPRRDSQAMDVDVDDTPVGGWSIRGAAERSEETTPIPISRSSSSSLLDRMNPADSTFGLGVGGNRGSLAIKRRVKGRS